MTAYGWKFKYRSDYGRFSARYCRDQIVVETNLIDPKQHVIPQLIGRNLHEAISIASSHL